MYLSRFYCGLITLMVITLLAGCSGAAASEDSVYGDISQDNPSIEGSVYGDMSQDNPSIEGSVYGDMSHGNPSIGGPVYGDMSRRYPVHRDPCSGGGCQPVCGPFKTDVKSGYLSQGQSATTGYYIPSYRSSIEWILTGPSGEQVIPMSMMSVGEVSSRGTWYHGCDFDLYIYQNYYPRHYGGNSEYSDTNRGSNAYVRVPYPRLGSTYYAQVYAKSGSGHYTLTCRSYTCHDNTVMMSENPVSTMMYAATSVASSS